MLNISQHDCSKEQEKMDAILEICTPSNQTKLKLWLGLSAQIQMLVLDLSGRLKKLKKPFLI